MPFSTIVARIDADDKRNFKAFCASVGLNASIAINLFVKTVLRENRIPFNISGKSKMQNEQKLATDSINPSEVNNA